MLLIERKTTFKNIESKKTLNAPTKAPNKEKANMQGHGVWQYKLWSFQTGDTKLERFLPKNQHTQRKLLNFEFWINGELSNVPKFDFQSQFSMSKIIGIFLVFFY